MRGSGSGDGTRTGSEGGLWGEDRPMAAPLVCGGFRAACRPSQGSPKEPPVGVAHSLSGPAL